MQITVKNYRGCQSADFDLHNITLIGGKNAAGKSSIAQATAALFTGNPLPLRGITKTAAGQLVRSGTANGSALLGTDDGDPKGHDEGSTSIAWPKVNVSTNGIPPTATEFATGLACILNLSTKDRAAALAGYLKTEPNRDDFDGTLKPLDLPTELLDQLWSVIKETGWDGAHQNCKEKGARLKGQWEQITGDRYGSKKADNWLPEGWEPELDGLSEESLAADVADAKAVLEAAISADAVDESKRAELEAAVSGIVGIKDLVDELGEEAREIRQRLNDAKAELKSLPPAEQPSVLVCPKCSESLEIFRGELRRVTLLSGNELKGREHDIAVVKNEIVRIQAEADAAQSRIDSARSDLSHAQKAEAELNEMATVAVELNASISDVDTARTQLQHSEARLRAFQQKTQADNRHANIVLNAELIKALSPSGIRLKKLVSALASANKALEKLSALSGDELTFGTASLDADLEASLNGTPYHLLSKSERWRVRCVMQVWMATIDGSSVVIIDGADILTDKPLRNGLFTLLNKVGIPALITMSLPEEGILPNLAAAGLGVSYWVENGVLKRKKGA